jgi:short-subunit dehydrogenase
MVSLKEKTALITGASSGIGRAIALELAALGALVLLVARTPQKLESVAAEIENAGGAARAFAVDFTDDGALLITSFTAPGFFAWPRSRRPRSPISTRSCAVTCARRLP